MLSVSMSRMAMSSSSAVMTVLSVATDVAMDLEDGWRLTRCLRELARSVAPAVAGSAAAAAAESRASAASCCSWSCRMKLSRLCGQRPMREGRRGTALACGTARLLCVGARSAGMVLIARRVSLRWYFCAKAWPCALPLRLSTRGQPSMLQSTSPTCSSLLRSALFRSMLRIAEDAVECVSQSSRLGGRRTCRPPTTTEEREERREQPECFESRDDFRSTGVPSEALLPALTRLCRLSPSASLL
mmetsp:Transcript_49323/g.157796  ORF Transcript_49323/g.157796 Transcript_49323/m.157796 type:complete len:244 (+) Transcript_49323:573-1304(+)